MIRSERKTTSGTAMTTSRSTKGVGTPHICPSVPSLRSTYSPRWGPTRLFTKANTQLLVHIRNKEQGDTKHECGQDVSGVTLRSVMFQKRPLPPFCRMTATPTPTRTTLLQIVAMGHNCTA